jgi:hypothetical protein
LSASVRFPPRFVLLKIPMIYQIHKAKVNGGAVSMTMGLDLVYALGTREEQDPK